MNTAAPEALSPYSPNTWLWIITGLVLIAGLALGSILGFKKLRVAQVKSTMKGLTIALHGYDSEYGLVKPAGGLRQAVGMSETTDLPTDGAVLDALIISGTTSLNPRKIRFFDPPAAKGRANGFWIDASGVSHLSDPWGNPFLIRADMNSDGMIPVPEKPGSTLTETYLIYSAGTDGDASTWGDNITSWK